MPCCSIVVIPECGQVFLVEPWWKLVQMESVPARPCLRKFCPHPYHYNILLLSSLQRSMHQYITYHAAFSRRIDHQCLGRGMGSFFLGRGEGRVCGAERAGMPHSNAKVQIVQRSNLNSLPPMLHHLLKRCIQRH